MNVETVVTVLNFNGKHLLKKCLLSLEKQSYKKFKILMIDNGSTDGSVSHVQRNFPQVDILSLKKNYGFTKAINRGIAYAIEKYAAQYVAVLNNDTKAEKDWLTYLVKRISSQEDIAAVTSNMLFLDSPETINSQGGTIDWNGDGYDININISRKRGKQKSNIVLGACWGASLIRTKTLPHIGLLDERYFAYYEDLDWSWRANILGYKIFFEEKAVIYHKGSATWKGREYRKIYLNKRNALCTCLKNYEGKNLSRRVTYIVIGYWFFILDHLVFSGNFKKTPKESKTGIPFGRRLLYVLIPMRAILWNIVNLKKTLQLRKEVQSKRVRRDDFIFSLINQDETPVRVWVKNIKQKLHITQKVLKPVFGVNLFGYLDAESGVGEAARTMALTIQKTNVPIALINYPKSPSRKKDARFAQKFSKKSPYAINLIVIYGDTFKDALDFFGEKYFKGKYNIAYWAWELSTLPKKWVTLLDYVDEIWVPSSYVKNTIQKSSAIPITVVPHAIQASHGTFDRKYFSIAENKFIFLFMFDFYSIFERKNPLAIVRIFKKVFKKGEQVELIIKCSNSEFDLDNFKKLQRETKNHSIKIINTYLSRNEVNSLLSIADCYVSLHRSEGFGLTIAESMALGKPVIATNYSGNADFMTTENSFPVDFKLTKLKKSYGPYKKGNVWAQFNENQAAKLMRYVFDNQKMAQKKGIQAKKDMETRLSPEAVAKLTKKRLSKLQQLLELKQIHNKYP